MKLLSNKNRKLYQNSKILIVPRVCVYSWRFREGRRRPNSKSRLNWVEEKIEI